MRMDVTRSCGVDAGGRPVSPSRMRSRDRAREATTALFISTNYNTDSARSIK
jgi:hypothetical protein